MVTKRGLDTYDPVLGAVARYHRNRKKKEKKRAVRRRKADEEWEETTRVLQEQMEIERLVQLQMQSELENAIFREVEREAKRAGYVSIRALAACLVVGLVGLRLWCCVFS